MTTLYWVLCVFIALTVLVCVLSYVMYMCNICSGICGDDSRVKTNIRVGEVTLETNLIDNNVEDTTHVHELTPKCEEVDIRNGQSGRDDRGSTNTTDCNVRLETNNISQASKKKYKAPPIPSNPAVSILDHSQPSSNTNLTLSSDGSTFTNATNSNVKYCSDRNSSKKSQVPSRTPPEPPVPMKNNLQTSSEINSMTSSNDSSFTNVTDISVKLESNESSTSHLYQKTNNAPCVAPKPTMTVRNSQTSSNTNSTYSSDERTLTDVNDSTTKLESNESSESNLFKKSQVPSRTPPKPPVPITTNLQTSSEVNSMTSSNDSSFTNVTDIKVKLKSNDSSTSHLYQKTNNAPFVAPKPTMHVRNSQSSSNTNSTYSSDERTLTDVNDSTTTLESNDSSESCLPKKRHNPPLVPAKPTLTYLNNY